MEQGAFFAGIDIGGTSIKLGLLDGEGSLLHMTRFPTVIAEPAMLAERIAEAIHSIGLPVCAAGVSCAGRVDRFSKTVTASNLRWKAVPFGTLLKEAIGCPVAIDNDVAGALLGEWAYGACVGEKNVIYLSIGTGIGGAFLIDGKPFRGYNNTGGEIGHMITHADGRICACGGRGCFEQYASATALSHLAGGRPTTEVFARAEGGDRAMEAVLDKYTHELAIGISGLLAVFRPQLLVLGGGLSEAGDPLLRRVQRQIYEKCPSVPAQEKPKIRLASLGNIAGVMGAATMAAQILRRNGAGE